eukprot:TRINITY_DN6499_c0_g1_i3.p1 TRINITY_DN6499_c0_g1~~TRINITY_DN6499_c0_g1_i3.p1  ORF type:complete len:105 (+),score=15.48 TRINITY_DN6499_c0_g1_i3:65-379(+)
MSQSGAKKYNVIMTGDEGRLDIMARFFENKPSRDGFTLQPNDESLECRSQKMPIDGKEVFLVLIDTANQEKFRVVTSSVYRRGEAKFIPNYSNNEIENQTNKIF